MFPTVQNNVKANKTRVKYSRQTAKVTETPWRSCC